MKKSIVAVIILCLMIIGCRGESRYKPMPKEYKEALHAYQLKKAKYFQRLLRENIRYVKDERTGLCFVFGSNLEYFTIVACERFKELEEAEVAVIKKQDAEDPEQPATSSP